MDLHRKVLPLGVNAVRSHCMVAFRQPAAVSFFAFYFAAAELNKKPKKKQVAISIQ